MRTSSSSTRKRAWALSWPGSSSRWPNVLRIPPRQNRDEDRAQENESEREADALPEIHRDVVHHDDGDDEADERNEVEQNPPDRLAGDLQQHDRIVDRDDCGPPR